MDSMNFIESFKVIPDMRVISVLPFLEFKEEWGSIFLKENQRLGKRRKELTRLAREIIRKLRGVEGIKVTIDKYQMIIHIGERRNFKRAANQIIEILFSFCKCEI